MVKLGDVVRDRVSNFKGVAVAKHSHLNGCDRISVQPTIGKDRKLPTESTFDEPQLDVIKKARVKRGSRVPGGPERYMPASRPGDSGLR